MYDSKHRTTDTQIYDTRKDASGYSSNKREWNLQTHGLNDEATNHRKYIRTQSSTDNRMVSSSSSSSSSQQQRQNGEKKSVKDTKKPLRVFGDWSEFKSSTGKTYFYNCKTEVSQWEKPKGWPSNESNRTSTSSTDRIKKESSTNISSTIRPRYKVEETSSYQKFSQTSTNKLTSTHHQHQNGNHKFQESIPTNEQLPIPLQNRLPSPGDDSSRMSFSSTSSKESSAAVTRTTNGNVLHSSLSEPIVSVSTSITDNPSKAPETHPIPINGNDSKSSITRSINPSLTNTDSTPITENESLTPPISKAEREQEIQKFYRAELIQHLTSWPSNQLEKQCLKLFDDYYGYNAKMSTAFTELKALKSNFRVLEIKRNILTHKLLRCEKHAEEENYP